MKKIISIFLAVTIIVGALWVPAFSADTVSEELSTDEIQFLEAFGILEGNETPAEFEDTISRAKTAEYFCRLLRLDEAETSVYDSIYYDVTSETPYYGYIKALSDMGYMIGYPDGRFRPVQSISTMEAARVTANILGYKDYIAAKGLEKVVLETGLTDGVERCDSMTLGQFLKVLYNALYAPACRIKSIGSNISYEINDDFLGMEYLFNVVEAEGIVDGIPGTGLDEVIETMNDNTVSIDGEIYDYDGDAISFLGYRVKFCYDTKANGFDIMYMKKSDKNRELVIAYDEIIDYDGFTYTYEQGEKDKTAKLSSASSVIFNGGAYPVAEKKDMIPAYGKVTLVDNNGDRTYDVAMIDSVEFVLAESVNPDKMKIFAVQDGMDVELEDADEVIITKDGEDYPLDRIINRDLLAIRRTKTESGYDKVIIEVVKSAKANSVLNGVNSQRVSVGEEVYPIWENIDDESKAEIKAGATVTLFTYEGIVVMAEASGSLDSYGYLVSVSEPEVFEDRIQFRLMQTNLKAATLDMNKTVKIDGTPYKASDIRARLMETATLSVKPPEAGEVSQPVKYILSSDGKLVSLDTLYFDSNKEDEKTSLRRLDTAQYTYLRTSNSFYDKNTGAFVAATKDNKAYRVPYQDRYSEADYEMYTLAQDGTYNVSATDNLVEVCNVDPDSCVAEFVYVYRVVFATGTWGAFIVEGKSQTLTEEGDVVKSLELINAADGKRQSRVVSEVMASAYDQLNAGDFIRITTNQNAEIIGISGPAAGSMPSLSNPTSKRVFKLTRGNHNTANPPYADGECMVMGTVLNVSAGKMLITTCLEEDPGAFDETLGRDSLPVSSAMVTLLENVRGELIFNEGSFDDIKAYCDDPENPSVVAVYISGGTVKTIFVLEK